MKKRVTKLFSVVLAVAMLTGLFVVPALADEVAVSQEQTVVVSDEIDQEETVEDAGSVTEDETETAETTAAESTEPEEETVPEAAVPAETADAPAPAAEEVKEEAAEVALLEIADGWQTADGVKLYYQSGAYVTGLQTISGKTYYFNKDGAMVTGWKKISGNKHYFNAKGVMVTGVKKIDGKYYVFNEEGIMQTGWQTVSEKTYYLNSKGAAVTGWKKVSGKKYYFNTKGVMQTGLKKISGARYYFNKKGVMQTKWKKVSGNWYFFNKKNGKAYTGGHTIGNVFYHFTKKGICLDYNNECKVSVDMTKKAKNYSSPTQYLIMVDCGKNRAGVYQGYQGHWKQIYFWPVSTGAGGSTTVKGVHSVNGNRGYSFGTDHYTCYWYSSFYGSYLMHSIKYVPGKGTSKIKDGRLGRSISGGCVRMAIENAKWVYDNIPIGTTVVTYK